MFKPELKPVLHDLAATLNIVTGNLITRKNALTTLFPDWV